MHKDFELKSIRIDGGTQPRAKIDEAVVDDYAAAMRDGAEFPPVIVYFDGVDNWLADGFHRFHAARRSGAENIRADTRTGTKRDAILYSVGANATHGTRRTNDDKRRAVMTLLNDPEWSGWSNKEIARHCIVDASTVDKWRLRSILPDSGSMKTESTFTHHKTGKPTTMRTENIGHKRGQSGARADHIKKIENLAKEGNNSEQISSLIGIDARTVRAYANESNIVLPEHIIGKVHRINNRKVIEQTVLGLEASAASLSTLGISLTGISQSDSADWANSLADSIRVFSSLRKKLQEHANEQAA